MPYWHSWTTQRRPIHSIGVPTDHFDVLKGELMATKERELLEEISNGKLS
jgi:hypothetical protein